MLPQVCRKEENGICLTNETILLDNLKNQEAPGRRILGQKPLEILNFLDATVTFLKIHRN